MTIDKKNHIASKRDPIDELLPEVSRILSAEPSAELIARIEKLAIDNIAKAATSNKAIDNTAIANKDTSGSAARSAVASVSWWQRFVDACRGPQLIPALSTLSVIAGVVGISMFAVRRHPADMATLDSPATYERQAAEAIATGERAQDTVGNAEEVASYEPSTDQREPASENKSLNRPIEKTKSNRSYRERRHNKALRIGGLSDSNVAPTYKADASDERASDVTSDDLISNNRIATPGSQLAKKETHSPAKKAALSADMRQERRDRDLKRAKASHRRNASRVRRKSKMVISDGLDFGDTGNAAPSYAPPPVSPSPASAPPPKMAQKPRAYHRRKATGIARSDIDDMISPPSRRAPVNAVAGRSDRTTADNVVADRGSAYSDSDEDVEEETAGYAKAPPMAAESVTSASSTPRGDAHIDPTHREQHPRHSARKMWSAGMQEIARKHCARGLNLLERAVSADRSLAKHAKGHLGACERQLTYATTYPHLKAIVFPGKAREDRRRLAELKAKAARRARAKKSGVRSKASKQAAPSAAPSKLLPDGL